MSFIDHSTEFRFVYYIRKKSDVLEALKQFKCGFSPYGKVKRLKSDNGGEYTGAGIMTLSSILHARIRPSRMELLRDAGEF